MRILKFLFFAISSVILLLLIISFFLPSKMHVERLIKINAPAGVIFEQVNNLKNWEKWSPWLKLDSTLQLTYEGPESGVGAIYKWTGNDRKTGSGKLTISASKPGELILTDFDFGEGNSAAGGFRFETTGGSTLVTWFLDSEMGFNPVMRYMGMMMKSVMEGVFDRGLNDIKKIAENLPPPAAEPVMTADSALVNNP